MSATRTHPQFAVLKRYVIQNSGLAYFEDKETMLAQKVAERMKAIGEANLATYFALISHNSAEFDELIGLLTIGETYFFRQPEQFEILKDHVIPHLLQSNQRQKTLRIWSAGCSVGAEAYTIAILLQDHFQEQLAGWQVDIIGTDINRQFLAQAQLGQFSEWTLRGLTEIQKKRLFTQTDKKRYKIDDSLKKWVNFQYHNLATNPFPSLTNNLAAMDVIFCRNVLIYFSKDKAIEMLRSFNKTLAPNGFYFPGYSEIDQDLYASLSHQDFGQNRIYSKTNFPIPESRKPEFSLDEALPTGTEWQAPDLSNIQAPPELRFPDEDQSLSISDRDPIHELILEAKWDEAMNKCQDRLNHSELDHIAHYYAALVYEALGAYSEALAHLQKVLYIKRDFVLGHYHQGLFGLKSEDFALSLRAFRNTISLLSKVNSNQPIEESDGMLPADLKTLAQMQMEIAQTCCKPTTT